MNLTVTLDLSGVSEALRELQEFQQAVVQAGEDLADQTHLHIKQQVAEKLNTRREMYEAALSKPTQIRPGHWDITLDRSAIWIEEGMEPHSMVDDLLRTGARTAKDGSRYKVIPFDQGKGGDTVGAARRELNLAVRAELKKRNIPYTGIERDAGGKPKEGMLHKFDILDAPLRPAGTEGKHGWGKGAVGQVMQGPNEFGGSGGGTPLLAGVRIYQTALFKKDDAGNLVPDLDKKGQQRAKRGIVTFRVVSSKHKGTKWNYPGIEGGHFFEDAERWVSHEWENTILPELLKRFGGR